MAKTEHELVARTPLPLRHEHPHPAGERSLAPGFPLPGAACVLGSLSEALFLLLCFRKAGIIINNAIRKAF